MTRPRPRMRAFALFVVIASACSSPVSNDPLFAVFRDVGTDFMTTDVHDVDNEVLRFDTRDDTLHLVASGQVFAGFQVDGAFVAAGHPFQVRFGRFAGSPRAYLTETGAATICDVSVVNGALSIRPTNVSVPR